VNVAASVAHEHAQPGAGERARHGVNSGGQYRSDGVDIEVCGDSGGGYDVGWTSGAEWLKYTVNVATARAYTVSFRVASVAAVGTNAGSFHLRTPSGTNLSGRLSPPISRTCGLGHDAPMRIKALGIWALVFAFGVGAGCSDDEKANGPAVGSERGACYGNKTCDDGLTCLSDLCVAVSGAGGDAGGSGITHAGNSASGNSAAGSGGADHGDAGASSAAGEPNGFAGGGEAGAAGAAGSTPPTAGALRLTWSLKGADSQNTLSCAAAGGPTVSVIGTKVGSPNDVTEDLFDCADGSADVLYDFGSYTFVVQLVNDQSQALGELVNFDLTFDSMPCVEVSADRCVKAKTVVLPVDGK